MRVITINVNGIRAAANKGLFAWLARQKADFVCLQETKAQTEQLDDNYYPRGFHCRYFSAQKKGYSGVALYSRYRPDGWTCGFGAPEFDAEGRYLEVKIGGLSVVSVYAPSGSSSAERQQAKFRFLELFMHHLKALKRKRRHYILSGDWNIAHRQIDLRNWRSNQKNSGFLPEERAWFDQLFGVVGYNDAFREICPQTEAYTWWSNRGNAWHNNVGWRIDYQVTSPSLCGTARKARIYRKQRFSDHAPLIMDYAIEVIGR